MSHDDLNPTNFVVDPERWAVVSADHARAHGFESVSDVENEDRKRVRLLRRTARADTPMDWTNMRDKLWLANQHLGREQPALDCAAAELLATKLSKGVRTGFAPTTLASAFHMRGKRVSIIGAMLKAFDHFPNEQLRTFTLINSSWLLGPGGLELISASTLKRQLVSHLNRAGVASIKGPLIAFLHGELEPERGLYQLHYHGLTTLEKSRALDHLQPNWGYVKTSSGAPAIHRGRVKDRTAQFSYLVKSFWPSKGIRLVDGEPKRDRRGQRIKGTFHSQVLLWLDRQTLREITILNQIWSPRTGGSAAMRELYLSTA